MSSTSIDFDRIILEVSEVLLIHSSFISDKSEYKITHKKKKKRNFNKNEEIMKNRVEL